MSVPQTLIFRGLNQKCDKVVVFDDKIDDIFDDIFDDKVVVFVVFDDIFSTPIYKLSDNLFCRTVVIYLCSVNSFFKFIQRRVQAGVSVPQTLIFRGLNQNAQIRNSVGLTFKIAQRGYPLLFGRFHAGIQFRISLDRLYTFRVFDTFVQNAHS